MPIKKAKRVAKAVKKRVLAHSSKNKDKYRLVGAGAAGAAIGAGATAGHAKKKIKRTQIKSFHTGRVFGHYESALRRSKKKKRR